MTLSIIQSTYMGLYSMKWYEKFKVGQRVKVIKKVQNWRCGGSTISWNGEFMDETLGKIYEITNIKIDTGYRLRTQIPSGVGNHLYDFWYPVESLSCIVGAQLLFSFMA